MNLFCFVGQIEELPVLKETPNGIKTASILMKIDRPFANSEGIYEQDHIQVEVWRGLAETVCDVCHAQDLIAVKGRVSSYQVERDGHVYRNYSFIAEKLDFLKK
ncbi:MAG: single-stranded DNA-binding protein [Erysipelotrichaceae bacterium]|jgi:single-strand DNA-binding protein|nr:single-stranded DNA-binding protein [Erysipelotrichaceae bacterium]